jgi:type II secretory ATPase GspE/PulE/Tfp pilus assembly ATPase PilB-like protein
MSNTLTLNTKLTKSAEDYAVNKWGWQIPTDEIIEQAVMCEAIIREGIKTGGIIAKMNLLDPIKVEQICRKKIQNNSPLPTLDFILQEENNNKDLQDKRNQIMAYASGFQFFTDIPTPDIDVHQLMQNSAISIWCKDNDAVLMLVQKISPVLVFSRLTDEALRFGQMGKVERRTHPITQAINDTVYVALANPESVTNTLNSSSDIATHNEDEESSKIITHIELTAKDASKGKKKFAEMHNFAFRNNCTDIHISPMSTGGVRVEFRIDKELITAGADLVLDMAEYHALKDDIAFWSGAAKSRELILTPKDGKYTYLLGKDKIDVRVVIIPKYMDSSASKSLNIIRLRLFKQEKRGPVELADIGIKDYIIEMMIKAIRPSSGLVLMVGPTGSGKSTGLFGMVNEHVKLYRHGLSRFSLEDPVERTIPDLDQVQVSDQMKKINADPFTSYLEFLLRADPDLFLLGEIRSKETAIAAAQFSATGHLVLSTLHADSTSKAIGRISDMLPERGQANQVVSALNYIFATRGLPKLCEHCKVERKVTTEEKNEIKAELVRKSEFHDNFVLPDVAHFKNKDGCQKCDHRGIKGIVPAIEVMEVNHTVRSIALNSKLEDEDKMQQLNDQRQYKLYDEINSLVKQGLVSLKTLLM